MVSDMILYSIGFSSLYCINLRIVRSKSAIYHCEDLQTVFFKAHDEFYIQYYF